VDLFWLSVKVIYKSNIRHNHNDRLSELQQQQPPWQLIMMMTRVLLSQPQQQQLTK